MYGEQMVRMLRAVDLLSTPAGATKQELADHLGVDKRTVQRLLGLLNGAGYAGPLVLEDYRPVGPAAKLQAARAYLHSLTIS